MLLPQKFGITWQPEVICVDLHEVGGELSDLTLILASDGIWDLWPFEDAFEAIMRPSASRGKSTTERADSFFKDSLQVGADTFGDDADNMTGIVVYFSDADSGQGAARASPGTPSRQAL